MLMQGYDTRIILVRAECLYVQLELLVFLHWFVVGGYKWSREGRASQVSEIEEKVECSWPLVWLGQLWREAARSLACLFPGGESVLMCVCVFISDSISISCVASGLDRSVPRTGARSLPFIR